MKYHYCLNFPTVMFCTALHLRTLLKLSSFPVWSASSIVNSGLKLILGMVYELAVNSLLFRSVKKLLYSYAGTKILLHFPAPFSFFLSLKFHIQTHSCLSLSQSPCSFYSPKNLHFSLPKIHCFPQLFYFFLILDIHSTLL